MGLVGVALVTQWSWGLLRDNSRLLLDHYAPEPVLQAVREAVEAVTDNRLYDFHAWSVAPSVYAAALGVVTHTPRPPEHYKTLITGDLSIAHVTVEVQERREAPVLHGRAACGQRARSTLRRGRLLSQNPASDFRTTPSRPPVPARPGQRLRRDEQPLGHGG